MRFSGYVLVGCRRRGSLGPHHLLLILEFYGALICRVMVKGELVFLSFDVLVANDV
jgi:hypothetical protein